MRWRAVHSAEQIIYALRQAEGGTLVADACRQLGVSEASFYLWKKYGSEASASSRAGRVDSGPLRGERAKGQRARQFSHGGWYGKSIARDQSALRLRITKIGHPRPRSDICASTSCCGGRGGL
jgi:Transposase